MKKIEAIVSLSNWRTSRGSQRTGIEGMTVSEVKGSDARKDTLKSTAAKHGRLPDQIGNVAADEQVERAVETIASSAKTGKIGDGNCLFNIESGLDPNRRARGCV